MRVNGFDSMLTLMLMYGTYPVGQDHDRTLKPDRSLIKTFGLLVPEGKGNMSGVPKAVRYINFEVAAKGLILAGFGTIAKLRKNQFRAGAESITT